MKKIHLIISKTYIGFALVSLIFSFILLGCSHGPPHDDMTVTGTCGDTQGAVWVNEPGRDGKVTVTWFPSSSDPEAFNIDMALQTPLTGNVRGPFDQLRNSTVMSLGSNTRIVLCCGDHNVTRALIVGHGTSKDYNYQGDRTSQTIGFGGVPLIKLETWTVNHCRRTGQDYTDMPVDFPLSVEMTCRRPNGSEYNVETTLEFKTVSTCKHQF